MMEHVTHRLRRIFGHEHPHTLAAEGQLLVIRAFALVYPVLGRRVGRVVAGVVAVVGRAVAAVASGVGPVGVVLVVGVVGCVVAIVAIVVAAFLRAVAGA